MWCYVVEIYVDVDVGCMKWFVIVNGVLFVVFGGSCYRGLWY